MNLIKFIDIYLKPDMWEGTTCPYTQEEMDWFNENLKGKYAYALNWRWVVPFEQLTLSEFVEKSVLNSPEGISEYCTVEKYSDYKDTEMTERSNSIDKYIALNQFSSDSDITIEEVKNFRTWLATTLRAIKDEEDMVTGEKIMLDYYANGMYDQTVNALSIFSKQASAQYGVVGVQSCGCIGSANTSLLDISAPVCDPLSIYRRGIYELMVSLWSEYKYWVDLESDDFLVEFKKYIDAVISYNLPLFVSDWTTVFADCTCLNSSDSLQAAGLTAMRNLSQALQYMIDGDIQGHKNFINAALRTFASQYYEKMQWIDVSVH